MPREYKTSKELDKILSKLQKKDKQLYAQILHKIEEILDCPDINHYKNLRYDLKDYKRAHVGHFVLVFRFEEHENLVLFTDFDHHDNIYQKMR